jgi:hypothetical protein
MQHAQLLRSNNIFIYSIKNLTGSPSLKRWLRYFCLNPRGVAPAGRDAILNTGSGHPDSKSDVILATAFSLVKLYILQSDFQIMRHLLGLLDCASETGTTNDWV